MGIYHVFPSSPSPKKDLCDWVSCHDGSAAGSAPFAVRKADSLATFVSAVSSTNGHFATVSGTATELWAAVDRIASIPLFYGMANGYLYVSTDAYWVKTSVGSTEMAPLAAEEIRYFHYSLHDRTLAKGVKRLRAGDILHAVNDASGLKIHVMPYYRFLHKDYTADAAETLEEKLDQAHLDVFGRMIESAGNKQLVVPLSGGLDSRLLACMLKRLGVDNVICFSYGLPGNSESRVSKYVAEKLGYPWLFFDYRRLNLQHESLQEDLQRLFWASGHLSTVPPALEDFLAVRQMRTEGLVEADALFCPGHSGDFTAGSHLCQDMLKANDIDQLADYLLQKHAVRLAWSQPQEDILQGFRQDIKQVLEDNMSLLGQWDPGSLGVSWDCGERQSKRIVNFIRTYEVFGYGWRLPFWDNVLMDFWASVPPEHSMGRHLLRNYLTHRSNSLFEGLFDSNDPRLRTGSKSKLKLATVLHKAVRRISSTRYFFDDRNNIRMVVSSFWKFLHMLGWRALSLTTVTAPWLFVECFGLQSIWSPDNRYQPEQSSPNQPHAQLLNR